MSPEMAAAHALITSLRPGDRVKVTGQPATGMDEPVVLTVQSPPARSDGPHGSPESLGVSVGYHAYRWGWNTRIDVAMLAAGRVTVERIPEEPAAPVQPS